MIEKIREIVSEIYDKDTLEFHILLVVKYAKELASKIEEADVEVIEAAALLHDIGRMKHGGANHHITGITEAKLILEKLQCDKKMIDKICHCIGGHSGKPDFQAKTIEAEIIRNADAIAHYDIIPSYFFWAGEGKKTLEVALSRVEKKIKHDRTVKLSLNEAKLMVKEKHDATKLLIKANKKRLNN